MASKTKAGKIADRWEGRWADIRRLAAGDLEASMELGEEFLTHLNFIFKGHEVLCVLKAENGQQEKLVAFFSGVDLESALYGVLTGLEAGNVTWRKDTPWKAKKAK